MKILGGMLPDYLGGYIPPRFAPMVMKRFEISEKLHLSTALLKMAGGECIPHIPSPPLDPPLCRAMFYEIPFLKQS